jgi:sulfoxide reductase heme-binding subunit YedZ
MSSITMPVRPTSGASSGGALAILGGGALAIAATTAYALATHGTGDQGIVLVTRHLARLAFPLFIAAFTASALLELAPSAPTRWVVRNRRWIGLAFAMVMFAHLAAIFALWSVREDEPHFGLDRVVGGLGYVFIAFMAATSNDGAVRALGRERWSRLHRVGLYLLSRAGLGGALVPPGARCRVRCARAPHRRLEASPSDRVAALRPRPV